jgi:hypothetical protein
MEMSATKERVMSNHLDFAASESAACEPTAFERWARRAESLLGHSLDGDQQKDGYSLDGAMEAWGLGQSVADFVASLRVPPSRDNDASCNCSNPYCQV